MTSPDGITWTARDAAEANGWFSVTYGNGMFVSVSTGGTHRVMTSGKPESNIVPTNNIQQGGMSIFGEVGIGTSEPSSILDVSQGATTSTNLDQNNSAYILGLAWNHTILNVTSVIGFPTKGTLIIGSEAIKYTGVDTNRSTFTNLTRGSLGTTAANHTNNTAIYYLTTSVIQNDSLTPYSVIASDGRMGVGTSTPATTLDIQGKLNVTGNVSLGYDTLFVDNTSSKVGIGTSAPSQKLTVIGNINATELNSSAITLGGSRIISWDDINISNIPLASDFSIAGNLTGANANFTSLNVTGEVLFTEGNVGIGTTTPTSTLDVAGSANITSSSSSFVVDEGGNIIINLN